MRLDPDFFKLLAKSNSIEEFLINMDLEGWLPEEKEEVFKEAKKFLISHYNISDNLYFETNYI